MTEAVRITYKRKPGAGPNHQAAAIIIPAGCAVMALPSAGARIVMASPLHRKTSDSHP